ncbi:hypothetical protein XENORESO_018150 [Xenotaenia resolanae]|uniref:Uncharacterized protein n=1 Tax=Xenotaenia resolanae TaxID=208358 RepID=A0ABV0WNR0_9TELE
MASRLSFGLGPAGSRKEQPGHQALSDESRPQAWLQGLHFIIFMFKSDSYSCHVMRPGLISLTSLSAAGPMSPIRCKFSHIFVYVEFVTVAKQLFCLCCYGFGELQLN